MGLQFPTLALALEPRKLKKRTGCPGRKNCQEKIIQMYSRDGRDDGGFRDSWLWQLTTRNPCFVLGSNYILMSKETYDI